MLISIGVNEVLFILIFTQWGYDIPEVSVMDYGLTGPECIQAIEQYVAGDPQLSKGIPSCEIDFGH